MGITSRKRSISTTVWAKLMHLVQLLAIINMYGELHGVAADIGGNRGAVVQLFTNFKVKKMALSKVL